ncbi:MAG: adenosine deaminase family protein [Opitutaceae bacterium]|jgi:adenosine deaminase|nr:adenosine deaminase family protein [Opitutaceae bacterium]
MHDPKTLRAFLLALPKTETHLHIEGALPYEILREWKPETYPENPPFRAPGYRYETFPQFDEILLGHALPWFTTPERYHIAAARIFKNLAAQNVRYVETSFHLPVTQFLKLDGRDILDAILSAAPPGMTVRAFTGMARNDYKPPLRDTIDDLGNWKQLHGVDLHGLETLPNEPWTAEVWANLRAAGKRTKAHAGEFGGAGRVREAIEQLGATRIQHGTRAIEDPAVVRLAADRGVTFDMCPISNVKLRVVPDIASHPIRRLMQAGIHCTVSTDDPLCFANTLLDEYETLANEAGFTLAELAQLARNGWQVADIPDSERQRHLAEIARVEKQFA